MKKILSIVGLLCVSVFMQAQIIGNGNRVSKIKKLETVEKVFVNINGTVNIISGAEENAVELNYDENIVDWVETKVKNKCLILDQIKWVEGTQPVELNIYLKELKFLENDSWSKITVTDLNQASFKVKSDLSKISLSGNVDHLEIISENGEIDASQLKSKKATISLKEDAYVNVYVLEEVNIVKNENGKINIEGDPKIINGNVEAIKKEVVFKKQKIDTRFIDIKLKTKGVKKLHCFVRGPKPDGNYFSYGLNLFPIVTKSERWSIGTKLYHVNAFGIRKLIYTVKEEDEGKIIRL